MSFDGSGTKFEDCLNNRLENYKDYDWYDVLEEPVMKCVAKAENSYIPEYDEYQLNHMDYKQENVLYDGDDVYFTDFEQTQVYRYEPEVVHAYLRELWIDERAAQNFIIGYGTSLSDIHDVHVSIGTLRALRNVDWNYNDDYIAEHQLTKTVEFINESDVFDSSGNSKGR